MTTIVLQTAARYLLPVMLLFSVFLVLRGHHEPGGGFVGGLVGSAAVILYAVAFSVQRAARLLRTDPRMLIGAGMLAALASGLVSCASGQPFLTGQWIELSFLGVQEFHLGTPLVFDVGVYLVVLGTVLTIILSLAEHQ